MLTMPKRMLPLVLVIELGPLCVGSGFIAAYEIALNKAIERAYIEAIALGVVGAIMFAIAPLGGAHQRPVVFASFVGGLYAVMSSAVFLFMIGQPELGFGSSPWMALIPVSLAMVGGAVFNIRYQHVIGQRQANAADVEISPYLTLVPALKGASQHSLWSHYYPETDTLAVQFTEPDALNVAAASDMTDSDVIVRRNEAGEVTGLTIRHASRAGHPEFRTASR